MPSRSRGRARGGSREPAPSPLWALLVASVLFAFWPGLAEPGDAPRRLVLALGAFVVGAGHLLAGRRTTPWGAFAWTVGAIVALGMASVLGLPNAARLESLTGLGTLALLLTLAALLASRAGEAGHVERGVLFGVAIGLLGVGLLGLLQHWTPLSIVYEARPPASSFVNRNVAAQAMLPGLFLLLGAERLLQERFSRAIVLLALGTSAAMLVVTRSRGAWIALAIVAAIGALVLLLRHRSSSAHTSHARGSRDGGRRAGLRRALPLAAALLAGSLAGTFVPESGERSTPTIRRSIELLADDQSSLAARVALWENTSALMFDAPLLGVGPTRFPVVYPLYHEARRETPGFGLDKRPRHVHNDPLQWAAELGLPAALALVGLFVGGVLLAFRRALREEGSSSALALSAGLAALAGLVHGMVSFPLHSPASALLVFLALGISWQSTPSRARRLRRPPVELGLLLVAFLVFGAQAASFRSQVALGEALAAEARGDCRGALEAAARVPGRFAPREARGLAAMIVFACDKSPERSLAALEPALGRDPHNLNLLLAAGARRIAANQAERAERDFERALAVDGELARAWLGLAMARDARGARREADEACARAVALAGNDLPEAALYCRGGS